MTADLECVEMAAGLAARGPDVERHLAACASCRATAAALAVVRQASEVHVPELWPRLRAQLGTRDEAARVYLRFPSPGWRAAAALGAIVTAASLAPEPGRLLAVMVGIL